MAKRDCPICGKIAENRETAPFCSHRCKEVDLSRWFTGSYSVPVVEHDDLPDDELGDFPEQKQQ